jgi:hypothetical protein
MLHRLIWWGAWATLCAHPFLALAADTNPARLVGVDRVDITHDLVPKEFAESG